MIKKAITETKSKGEVVGYRLNLPKDGGFKKEDIAIILSEEEYNELKDNNENLKQTNIDLEKEIIEHGKNEKEYEELKKEFEVLKKENEKLKKNNNKLEQEIMKNETTSKEKLAVEIAKIADDYIKSIHESNESHEKKIIDYERKLGIAVSALKQIEELSIIGVFRKKYKSTARENLKLIETPEEIEL